MSDNASLIRRLIYETDRYMGLASSIYPVQKIFTLELEFALMGAGAGTYDPQRSLIKYNLEIATRQIDEFCARTVPHEVAHHVVNKLWGTQQNGVRPHGKQWRSVMRSLGVKNISRCHSFDVEGIAIKRQRRFSYYCCCGDHALSTTIHNRIRSGREYRCTRCEQPLKAGTPVC